MLVYDAIPPRIPPRQPADARHCLVLHGLGDSMAGWQPVVPMLGLDRVGFVFANAPDEYGEGYSWFDIGGDFVPDHHQIRRSRALLEALIDQLLRELGIASEQLAILGFSQGSLMTLDVGLRSPRRFAGLVGISGFMAMLEEFPAAFGAAAREQRILLTHGLYDQLIPIAFARRQRDQLSALGIAVDWREYPKAHTLDPQRELADVRAFIAACCRTGAGRP
jgi:phospholipase/carboxylesterase